MLTPNIVAPINLPSNSSKKGPVKKRAFHGRARSLHAFRALGLDSDPAAGALKELDELLDDLQAAKDVFC